MSEAWSLGEVYGRKELDGVLVHTAMSARAAAMHAIAGLRSLTLQPADQVAQLRDELTAVVLHDAYTVLSQLPKGVGMLTPQSKYNVACSLDTPFFITVEPLDGFEWLQLDPLDGPHEERSGLFTSFSAVQDGEVIGAYAIDLITGKLFRVRPQDIEQRLVVGVDKYGVEFVPVTMEGSPASITQGKLILQGMRPEPHSDLLRRFGALDFRAVEPTLKGRMHGLLEVAAGSACAYFRPAGDDASRWIESPLNMFASVAGIRRFELRNGVLHEVSQVEPAQWNEDALGFSLGALEHGVLYAGGGYVAELSSRIAMRTLG